MSKQLAAKFAAIVFCILCAALFGWWCWRAFGAMTSNPRNRADFACVLAIMALPVFAIYTRRGRNALRSQPKFFWIVGGAMLAIAVLLFGSLMVFALRYPSSTVDVAIPMYCVMFFFGGGLMVFATPTIFTVSSLFARSKEKN